MKFFKICAEVLVPKFTRAEVRLPVKVPSHFIQSSLHFLSHLIPKGKMVTSYQSLHASARYTDLFVLVRFTNSQIKRVRVTYKLVLG